MGEKAMEMSNVTSIYDNSEVQKIIENFLKRKGQNSINTMNTYQRHIRDFFKAVQNKDVNQLTEKDILSLKFMDFEDFMINMKKEGVADATVNQKIAAVKKLLQYMRSSGIMFDTSILGEVVSNKVTDENEYGKMTHDEVMEMIRLAGHERNKSYEKQMVLKVAYDTALRKAELRKIKWSDFEMRDNGVYFKVLIKGGKIIRKRIKYELYNELLPLKKDNIHVFTISEEGIGRMERRLSEKMGLDPERNIVVHSIRKASITFYYRKTRDAYATHKFSGHESFDTTMKYIKEEDDYGITWGAVSSAYEVKDFDFNSLSKEELAKLINSMDKTTQLIMAEKAVNNIKEQNN